MITEHKSNCSYRKEKKNEWMEIDILEGGIGLKKVDENCEIKESKSCRNYGFSEMRRNIEWIIYGPCSSQVIDS